MKPGKAKRLQHAANGVLGRRRFKWRKVKEDGELGERSRDALHMACWLLGFSDEQLDKIHRGKLTPHIEAVLLGEKPRSEAMKRRDAARRDDARRKRKKHKEAGTLGSIQVVLRPGEPHYNGSSEVLAYIEGFLLDRGLPLGSGKRTPAHNAAIGGSSTSDHLTTKTSTDARDFPTFSGEDDARALAAHLGNASWSANSYATFDIRVDGHTFRIQILWGSHIGHGDHVHVGVSFIA
jgi:hypothetical protein